MQGAAFIAAVRSNADWPLVFPAAGLGDGETISHDWPGETRPVPYRVMRRVSARQLWERILRATYDYGPQGNMPRFTIKAISPYSAMK
jgi:ribonucleoside-diphosphate reductase alpha chain